MPSEIIRRIYEESWKAYLEKRKYNPNPGIELGIGIASLVGSGKKCLDIGCGTGKCMIPIFSHGNEVVGVDIAPIAVSFCRNLGFTGYQLDIENDDIAPLLELGPFDVCIMADILEHLIDPLEVLRTKVLPLLKTNGRLIATVPNFVYICYRFEFLIGRISHFGNDDATGHNPPRPYNLGHKTLFNRSNLYETFILAGFRRVTIVPETFSESLSKVWRLPFMRYLRFLLKSMWPTLLAARFLVIAER